MRPRLALLAALCITPALADETESPLVITATRVPTLGTDIPAGVTIIDRQTIERQGDNTLVDVLQNVPGLHVSPSGGPGGQASVFVRGTNSNHVLVLRDGMPINDAAESSGAFNFGVDTLADVERIEIIRGPMAAVYGSGAIGGVINLISRRGSEPGVHWQGDLSAGYPKQVRGSVVASGLDGRADYALSFASQSQRGYDTTPQRMSIYTGTPQGFRDRVVTLNLGYSIVPGTRMSLLLRARKAVFGFNELGDPTFDDANATGNDAALLGRIGVASELFDGTYQTGLFLGREQTDRRYTELMNPGDNTSVDDRYHSYRIDLQWNNTLRLNDFFQSSVLSDTDLTFGYEHTSDRVHVRTNDSFGGFGFAQNANAALTENAGYLGLQSKLWERLTVTGQARQDWVGPDAPTTWRLGAVVDATEIATRVRAAYGTAFREPSLFDRFGVDSTGYVGNPGLKPERARGWEIGFTTSLPAMQRADFVSFGATYFNTQVNNLIVAVFVPVDTAVNVGSAHMQGVETELTFHPVERLTVQAAWTITNAQSADDGSRLLRRPQHSGSATAVITPLPGLTIAPELLYTGAFRDFLVDDGGNSTGAVVTSPHGLIANLAVTYNVAQQVQLYANGTNLFYSKFEPVNGFQTPGPTVIAGIRLRL